MDKENVVRLTGYSLEHLVEQSGKPGIIHFGSGSNQKVFSFTEDAQGHYNLLVGQLKSGVVLDKETNIKAEDVQQVAIMAFGSVEALGAITAFLNMAYQSAIAEQAEKENFEIVDPEEKAKPVVKRGRPKKQD